VDEHDDAMALITMSKSEALLVWWNRRAQTRVTYEFRVRVLC
jgi:hypothetical protein